jgi:(p)ppGpp synthase/HD superfamily hydrolase
MNVLASFFSDQLQEQQADIAAAISQPLWQKAAAFAALAHACEVPPDEVPPSFAQATRVAVTLTAVYHCQETPVLATALLHNVLEKTTVSLHEIENHFGRLIASRVERLSRYPGVDEDVHLKRLHACDWQTRLVKLADAAANLDDEGEALEKRIHDTMPVLDLAFGTELPVLRAQRHLMALLTNARMAAQA